MNPTPEQRRAIEALRDNSYHNFHEGDATGIVLALYRLGFRIIKEEKS